MNLDIFPLLMKEVRFSEFVVNRSQFNFAFYRDLTNTWTPKKVTAPTKEKRSRMMSFENLV